MAALEIPIVADEQYKYIQEAERFLEKAGITFDVDFDLDTNTRIWDLGIGLQGAKLVKSTRSQTG